ncbi:MAG TPA: helix-turn-helix domain-containing protein [Caulobacteraceae bacterium]|jgi:HTH-type transcriptional regulator/antitoxin HigA
MELFPIRNDEDHARAVREIARLWSAPDDSPDADVLDALATLVDAYERKRYPIKRSSPIEALRYAIEEGGRSQAEFAALIGSRSRASEILNGKRGLTVDQIRLVSKHWHVPAALLIGDLEDAA